MFTTNFNERRAANPETHAVFGIWQDHSVHRKPMAGGEEAQGET